MESTMQQVLWDMLRRLDIRRYTILLLLAMAMVFGLWNVTGSAPARPTNLQQARHKYGPGKSDAQKPATKGNDHKNKLSTPGQNTYSRLRTKSTKPVFLHILGYQRTASRVISDMIADLPGQFYLYEPLAMSLSAMYGTEATYNVPTDIWAYPDGKLRNLDDDEAAVMLWTMDTVFQCNMAYTWPMQFLVDMPLWFIEKASPVTNLQKCYKHHGLRSGVFICRRKLRNICGKIYNSKSREMYKCKKVFWKDGNYRRTLSPNDTGLDLLTPVERQAFQDYFNCINAEEPQVRQCARQTLDVPCQNANVRAMKTVRAPMTIAEPFLKEYPNYKLVHLFRDPRGNVNSRQGRMWALSIYEKKQVIKHAAELYCKTVLSDYKIHQSLRTVYPGRSLQIISDDFMVMPLTYVRPIADLMGVNPRDLEPILTKALEDNGIKTQETDRIQKQSVVESVSRGALTGNARLQSWHTSLGDEKVRIINGECQDFFKTIPYNW